MMSERRALISSPNTSRHLEVINELIEVGRNKKILQKTTEDERYNGREVCVDGKRQLNFGSCSYLGLDIDPRLKEATFEAASRFGVQFSSSRAYLSCTLYEELEDLLEQIFELPILITPSTTLGHQSVIPTVVGDNDLVVLDQQVHASVQYHAKWTRANGTKLMVLRHNRLKSLEEILQRHQSDYRKIWYMADGVYSMYGDLAPIPELHRLLDKTKNFYLYVDDAHGMSWCGEHGRGFVLSSQTIHPRMIVGTSLNKAFSAAGGCFVFPERSPRDRVRNVGGPMIFSGPIQPPMLGAAIASAKIHLSDELNVRQTELSRKIAHCEEVLKASGLPIVSEPRSPIFYVGVAQPQAAYEIAQRMNRDGFHLNPAVFPAVSEKRSGIRFTVTNHLTFDDIEEMCSSLSKNFEASLEICRVKYSDINRAFRSVKSFVPIEIQSDIKSEGTEDFEVQHETTITEIQRETWDSLFASSGANDWEQMRFFERTFGENSRAEHQWNFHYYIVRCLGKPIAATFCTVTLVKDDMFASAAKSRKIEEIRKTDRYYMTTRTFMMGCLLSVGRHLYLDRERSDWKDALRRLLEKISEDQAREQAPNLCLRDFSEYDNELCTFFYEQGFFKMFLPDSHTVDNIGWSDEQEYVRAIPGSSSKTRSDRRRYVRKKAIENQECFRVEVVRDGDRELAEHLYKLYVEVSRRNFEINGFQLERPFFEYILKDPQWEVLVLYTADSSHTKPIGFAASYITTSYNFLLTGMDYRFRDELNLYPQILWQTIKRANELKLPRVNLGLTASQNKRKFGALAEPQVAFVQLEDNYSAQLLDLVHGT